MTEVSFSMWPVTFSKGVRMKFLPVSITAVTVVLYAATPAHAIPSFSRQIGADCRTCHIMSNKGLNKYGRKFKLNAFFESKEMRNQRLKTEKKSD